MAGKSKGKHKFHSVLTAAADVDNKSFGYDFASLVFSTEFSWQKLLWKLFFNWYISQFELAKNCSKRFCFLVFIYFIYFSFQLQLASDVCISFVLAFYVFLLDAF